MKLQEAMDMMLIEASVQSLTTYMQNVNSLFDKGNVAQAIQQLGNMLKTPQPIKGKFEAAEQGQLKSLAETAQKHLESNKDKADAKQYSAAVQSLGNLQKMLQQARANVVGQQQQVTKRRMAPTGAGNPTPSAMPTR